MKCLALALIKMILGVELAFAGSPAPMTTHVEQVSAKIDGQQYQAQITRVTLPTQQSRTLVLNEIAVAPPNGPIQTIENLNVESPAQLNGVNYIVSVPEPLS